MPIIDSDKIKGEFSLENICDLNFQLKFYEEKFPSLVHAKNHGFPECYDNAVKEIPILILQAKAYGLEQFEKISDRIKSLEKQLVKSLNF